MVHCFPHRLNNILKRTFYSAGTKEKGQRRQKKNINNGGDRSPLNDLNAEKNDGLTYDDDEPDSSESESDDDIILDTKSVELSLRSLSASPERDHVNPM